VPGFMSGSNKRPRYRHGAPCRTFRSAQRHAGGGSYDGADVAPPRSANANRPSVTLLLASVVGRVLDAFLDASVGCHSMGQGSTSCWAGL